MNLRTGHGFASDSPKERSLWGADELRVEIDWVGLIAIYWLEESYRVFLFVHLLLQCCCFLSNHAVVFSLLCVFSCLASKRGEGEIEMHEVSDNLVGIHLVVA